MNFFFSQRSLFEQEPNRITRHLDAARKSTRDMIDLTRTNPTSVGLPYASLAIVSSLSAPDVLSYEPIPFGRLTAREAIAVELASSGATVPPSNIVLTASTSESYSFLFKLLCDAGDEILIPQPSYPLFAMLGALESVRLVPYRLAYDGEWHLDIPSIQSALSPRTRGIIIVHPNNPTGSYLKVAELDALAHLGIPIVSDEVFATFPIELASADRAATALLASESLVFALGGLSKMAGLPQMKAGWIAVGGPEVALRPALRRLEIIADTFLSVGTPVQVALPTLLQSRREVETAILNRIRNNDAWARQSIASDSVISLLKNEGGWSLIARLPRFKSEEEWCLEFIDRDGVNVHPGHYYDFEDEAYVIMSLLTPEAEFRSGFLRIVNRVNQVG